MRYLALLMIGCLSLPAYALTQVDIYRTEVAIDSTKDKGEELARQQAMKQVIVRASGYQDSVDNPVVTKALQSSARYISQLSYGKEGDVMTLKLLFNDAQIRSLLTQAQLPFWPTNRNNLLVWLVEEQNYDRKIVWEHSASNVSDQLKQAARDRGLPLTLPVGDFDDITGIEVSDLWGGFAKPISLASGRYPVDGVLVIRAQGNSLRWNLYDQSPGAIARSNVAPVTGSANGGDAATQLINAVADFYAKRSAVVVLGESSESVVVKFLNINNAIDFFTLEKTLTSLNSVANLDVLEIKGNELMLRVHLLASQEAFEQEATKLSKITKFDDPLLVEDEENAVPVPPIETQVQPTKNDALTKNDEVGEPAIEPIMPTLNEETTHSPVVVEQPPAKPKYQMVFEWLS
ncbi:conserved hypothetical protein [Vibrio vulnificus YJ016]|uniref:DUF2066 domain-containing protein n=1 Tax=Vibrio vulnificus (strain YJ016) TaxID=196600 RepID=Q7MIK4_VIBVY|nr:MULTISPECIES: DUF2066 domain-containing protein [Vibrio]EGQ7700183.1 DUF2066 domain-containing protein [Vibrio vulnificus]EGQ7957943.1 DUF2066 domain-containing protein [Vibrio vulnificus]EGQ7988056.1 DUF2066 domain-containing protein [Vibrio vulnificus]EGQ8172864.1 DUF2066 domain-containing protein [Vibrio vulnificus]EGQ9238566.1 DUF2066 domain-containing protein [Vibrio vulnificus]